jgi:hypothetical protein
MGGQHPGLGGMGGRQSPLLGGRGMSLLMSSHPRYGFPPQVGMTPGMGMGMSLGMGMGVGMGMEMGSQLGLGTGLGNMGISPYMEMDLGMGIGVGRSPLGHLSYRRQRHFPFSYGSPGPPRAHSFLPQQRHTHSPFSHARRSPLTTPSITYEDEDEYAEGYRILPRRPFGRQVRGQPCRYMRSRLRRRDYQRSMFEESEDEYYGSDDYDDEYDGEGGVESLFPRQSPQMRLRY